MTSQDAQGIVIVTMIVLVLSALVGIGVYIWYALALSRLFPRLGGEGWKGWVPVLNEAEILARGGVPAWSVVFYFIPIVQLYGLYLKIVAVHRINALFGRGAGSTVLGILLPPVWATLLAWGAAPDPENGRLRTAGPERAAAPQSPGTTGVARDASGYTIPSLAPNPADVAPAAPPVAPVLSVGVPAAPPSPPGANPWAPRPVATAAPSEPAVVPSEPAAVPSEPAVAATVAPPPPAFPSAAAPPPPPPAVIREAPRVEPVATPAPVVEPVATPAPVVEPVATPEPAIPDSELAFAQTVIRPTPPMEDDIEATVVVDRRPRIPWRLVLDDGTVLPIEGPSVVLGRNPAAGPGHSALSVPDTTRTLSKTHARLDLDDGRWRVTDLDSTNGVLIVGEDGQETLLEPGASAIVADRFVLGTVGLRITVEGPS